jgi:hypothetical protein
MADENKELADSKDATLRSNLDRELEEVNRELEEMFKDGNSWYLTGGPLRIKLWLPPPLLSMMFASLHFAAGLGGIWLILRGSERGANLGSALLVGALFGIGAFMAAVWGKTVDKTAWMYEILHGERTRERFRELVNRQDALRERLAALESTPDVAE